MPSTGLLITFLITTAVFAYVPGPAMLYAAAQTMAHGARPLVRPDGDARYSYLRLCARRAAAAGLSALFHAVPTLYLTVKLVGAAYLIWMGVSLFRAKSQGDAALPDVQAKSGRRALFESIAVEVLNPKTAIFFVALLPPADQTCRSSLFELQGQRVKQGVSSTTKPTE
ncbi:LysE family translocator [Sinorhizobium fredii]|uniref:LysE family translocator n=1 Tax=Rhizobium fredii TaxID=380 RepID=UPI0004B1CCBD|nr:LysE family translocator [Sinorhizobium fredii]